MRRNSRLALVTLLTVAPAAVAWTRAVGSLDVIPESRLWIAGTSTVRGFECKASAFDATIESTLPGAVSAVLAGDKAVGAVELKVPVARLDCGNGTMNEHMLKALKAKDNPTIVFKVSSYDLAKSGDAVQVKMVGELTLGGVTKPVTITAAASEGGSGTLRVTGAHEIRMTEYGLKPPSLFLGTMKVNELVKVNFDFVLKN
jgi:uncharacterized protein YbaA (DUF1428 family)